MPQGYFVGRKELIGWIQQHFQPNFQKIEDLASGTVYCQIIDSIYPGAVAMSKVKMSAKTEVDSIHNFKVLQTAFSKKRIDRFIDVDKLVKRSFQTNMEFLQVWQPHCHTTTRARCASPPLTRVCVRATQFMKCYWDMHAPNGSQPESAVMQEAAHNEPTPEKPPPARKEPPKEAPAPKGMAGGPKRAGAAPRAGAAGASRDASTPRGGEGAAVGGDSAQQQQLALEVTELKLSVENLERERDFYYSKLREVEVLCQAVRRFHRRHNHQPTNTNSSSPPPTPSATAAAHQSRRVAARRRHTLLPTCALTHGPRSAATRVCAERGRPEPVLAASPGHPVQDG